MSRADRLQSFVARYHEKPIEWGVDDCSMWPALWVQSELGVVLDTPDVSGRQEAFRHLKRSGGIDPVWDAILDKAGIQQGYGDPCLGDVGLIETRATGTIGAIFAINSAVVRADVGFSYLPLRAVLKFWTVPEC